MNFLEDSIFNQKCNFGKLSQQSFWASMMVIVRDVLLLKTDRIMQNTPALVVENITNADDEQLLRLYQHIEAELLNRLLSKRTEAKHKLIKKLMVAYGIRQKELGGQERLYRNPDDPWQFWRGRGRKPKWLVAALASGKTLDDLEVMER